MLEFGIGTRPREVERSARIVDGQLGANDLQAMVNRLRLRITARYAGGAVAGHGFDGLDATFGQAVDRGN